MEEFDVNSHLIGKALGYAFNTEIKFFTHCYLRVNKNSNQGKKKYDPYELSIISFGSQEIFIFKDNFKKSIFRFKYNKIKCITLENNIKYNIMIHLDGVYQELKEKKIKEIPYLYLIIPERNYFIENLMCCYTVFYILSEGCMKNLLIKSIKNFNLDEFDINDNKILSKHFKKQYNNPPANYLSVLKLNYQ